MTSSCFTVLGRFLFLNKFEAYSFARVTHSLDFCSQPYWLFQNLFYIWICGAKWRILHTFNIYIARSNLVSLSSPDVHLMGEVQVRMKIYVYSGLYLASYTFPFFFLRQEAWKPFMLFFLFQGGAVPFCNHYSWTLGVMDMYVDDPRRWINLNFFGDTKFEQAHNAEDSHRFGLYMYGSGMGIGKVEYKSLPGFAFSK